MKLAELVDPTLLSQRVDEKYIKVQSHPSKPYVIYNYTDQAMWSRAWDDATRVCRGLIVDTRTDEVIARGPNKFFNAFEPDADEIAADEPVVVTEKVDGSLGLLMWADDRWEIATRGSFSSEQAVKATELWHEKYNDVRPTRPWSFFFEIVYPANRIVVDYGGTEDLVLLGAVDLDTGYSVPTEQARELLSWPGPVAETFPYATKAEAFEAPARENAEGFVFHAPRTNARQKWKLAEYVRLHRLLTGLTARRLWEYLAVNAVAPTAIAGKKKTPTDYMSRHLHLASERIDEILQSPRDWQDALVQSVPEEFEGWVRTRVKEIVEAVDRDRADVVAAYTNVRAEFDEDPVSGKPRGEFVKLAQARYPEHWHLLMTILDGMPVEAPIWERHRPAAERAFAQQSEEVA